MILVWSPIQAGAGECICTARLCYEKLHLYEEGLAWARRALRKDDASSDHFLRARCNIYIGIGCALKCKGVEEQVCSISCVQLLQFIF